MTAPPVRSKGFIGNKQPAGAGCGGDIMDCVRLPRTLRSRWSGEFVDEAGDVNAGRKITLGCLIAVASITGARAQ